MANLPKNTARTGNVVNNLLNNNLPPEISNIIINFLPSESLSNFISRFPKQKEFPTQDTKKEDLSNFIGELPTQDTKKEDLKNTLIFSKKEVNEDLRNFFEHFPQQNTKKEDNNTLNKNDESLNIGAPSNITEPSLLRGTPKNPNLTK